MPRRVALGVALAAVVGMTAACGLPTSSTPVLVPKAEVPYGLLDQPTPSPTLSAGPGTTLASATIYLADTQQHLVPVDVQVPQASTVPLLQSLLNRLAVGPSERERSRGLLTDLGPGSTIVLRAVTNGTANIELQTANQDPSAAKLPVALGQIVLTAVNVLGVDRVVFVKDGAVAPVQGPSGGNLTSDPLTAEHYHQMLAPGLPPAARTVPAPGTPSTPTTTTTAP